VERTSSAATRIGELSEHRSLSIQDQPSGSTALVAELEAEGIDATGLPGDLANRDGVPALIDQLPTPLDPLVLADPYWSQYSQRNTFEQIIGPADR
jgi:hypothetical protein